MRRILLRQRGMRPQGEPFTGENLNKGIDMTTPELKMEDIRPKKRGRKPKENKKETVVTKVVKAIKKVFK